jgi:uncharacterized membrane protein YhdT
VAGLLYLTLTFWSPLCHSRPVTGLRYIYLFTMPTVSILRRLSGSAERSLTPGGTVAAVTGQRGCAPTRETLTCTCKHMGNRTLSTEDRLSLVAGTPQRVWAVGWVVSLTTVNTSVGSGKRNFSNMSQFEYTCLMHVLFFNTCSYVIIMFIYLAP